jgi:hypothetical protein
MAADLDVFGLRSRVECGEEASCACRLIALVSELQEPLPALPLSGIFGRKRHFKG